MTAAAINIIAAYIVAAVLQRRTRQPRRPDAVDYAEQEDRHDARRRATEGAP